MRMVGALAEMDGKKHVGIDARRMENEMDGRGIRTMVWTGRGWDRKTDSEMNKGGGWMG